MELGLFGINMGRYALAPDAAVEVACAAEAAGWDSVWTGEHFVLPDPPTDDTPAPPDLAFLDPWVALAHVAAHTSSLLLATGVIVVPLHHPLALAKRVASLDRVSGGRVLLGVGVGYLRSEFDAFGVPLAVRAAAIDETLRILHAAWTEPTIEGHTYLGTPISGVRAEPRPRDPAGPPLVVGGTSDPALRRAVGRGRGWYGFELGLDETAQAVAGLRRAADVVDRPASLGQLELSVTPPRRQRVDARLVQHYADLGVHRLVLHLPDIAPTAEPTASEYVARTPGTLGI